MGIKVLVVDDNEDVRRMLDRQMRKTGWEVHFANNGKDGVDEAWNFQPDLIVMDMHMPERGGHEAVRNLRQGGYKGKITGLTQTADHSNIEQLTQSGCNFFLVKPIGRYFVQNLEKMLGV